MIWNTNPLLIWSVVVILILNFLKYYWDRKWIYFYSWNIPGPLNLPFIGAGYNFFYSSNSGIRFLIGLGKKYPDIWKLWLDGQLIYGISNPKHIEKILTHPSCLGKGDLYDSLVNVLGTGLLTAPVAKWKRHRKFIPPSFGQRILDDFVGIFVQQSLIFTKKMEKYVGRKDIKIDRLTMPLFIDIISETIMGLEINAQDGNDDLGEYLERLLEIIMIKDFGIGGKSELLWKFHPLNEEFTKLSKKLNEIIQTVITRRQEAMKQKKIRRNSTVAEIDEDISPKKPAFLELLLESSQFTEPELHDEVKIFIIAGFDTTTKATCYLLEVLALYPDIQKKVFEESVDVLGDRDVEVTDLPKLAYTERVIKETLRLFPPVLFFSREVEEDIHFAFLTLCITNMVLGNENFTLPKGSFVSFHTTTSHRDPRYWPNPKMFDPDRFLPEEVAKRPTCSFLPFSYGPRNCIGSRYAIMELKTVIATVIRKYRICTQYNSVDEIEPQLSFLPLPKDGFKVYFESR